MNLDVPVRRQPKESQLCGPYAIAMILQYHGIRKPISEIAKETHCDKSGSYAPNLGIYLIRQGFDVNIVSLNPYILSVKEIGAPQDEIYNHFKKLHAEKKKPKMKKGLRYYMNFMDAGGTVTPKIPTIDDVIPEIRNKNPVGVLLTTNFLSGMAKANSHFNVITGYDAKHVYVNDPLWDSRGGKKKWKIDEYFYGIYANAFNDVDNASLIRIRPRR